MATVAAITNESLADVVSRLGDISLERIRTRPAFGTATEDDLIHINERKQGLCELVDGILVEKAVGFFESRLAVVLLMILETYRNSNNVGFPVGPDAMTRFAPGLVREPDVSFFRWDKVGERRVPRDPICSITPSLAVEILSRSNTKKEIERKIREYFAAGVELVWILDPRTETVRVLTSPDEVTVLGSEGVLSGGDVLPGFTLSIREWFDRANQ